MAIALPNATHAQLADSAFSYSASYVGDNLNNISGGIKTGSCYLGMAHITAGFDAQKAGLWDGGLLYLDAANTHGASPSAELLGDIQVVSNIDAGEHSYMQELWVQQSLGKVDLTLGLQDMNAEFAASGYGGLYLNSSFGILPVISHNIAAPIFPLTTLALTAKWSISDKYTLLGAVHDGAPTDFDANPYNLKWQFRSGDGLLAVTELQSSRQIGGLPGMYKAGVFSHRHTAEQSFDPDFPDSLNINTLGMYVYADQQLWSRGAKSLGAFAQLGYCPAETSINDFYAGMGFNFAGMFSAKGKDVLGLAVAHEHFNGNLASETAVELTYQYQLNTSVFVQPDLQYIFNPAGTGETVDNIFAATLRFGFSF